MKTRCLGCYKKLEATDSVGEYHFTCSKKIFGTPIPPIVDFDVDQIAELAKEGLNQHLGITGVQAKISVNLEKFKGDPTHRVMIVGLWGNFILKPSSARFPEMAVVEDATMHMATAAGISTAAHGLIRLKSGDLAYITRRFDREKKTKIAVEDFCQLSGLLTERKYNTSYEKAGKIILTHSSNRGLDVGKFFDILLFSFLTGNADMHLKNFSLMTAQDGSIELSPAYDLISTYLMPIDDNEEMALTINGKKAKLKADDFKELARTMNMPAKAIENSFLRLNKALPEIRAIMENSFLSKALKAEYAKLLDTRANVLGVH